MYRFGDSRARFYEAFSCDDVDSVHNDYQRHLLYLWMFPEIEQQKLVAWGTWAQATDGHVQEWLSNTGIPMDQPGGRVMGDTTSLYLLELYELWRNTGDGSLALAQWSSVQQAVKWMIENALGSDNYGLPQKVTTTYDHFGWQNSRSVVYNAHIYLTCLQAARAMAVGLANDAATVKSIDNALSIAEAALPKVFWSDVTQSFRATAEGNQTFTDSLYGQMLAHHNFGTFSYNNESQLWQHLDYEWQQNQDIYGMRVLSNPIQEDSIWMNGPPTWTYLQLSRITKPGTNLTAAFEPFKRMSENFRTRLRDQWNLRALTHTQTEGTALEHGAPREQGHYGFMMTDQYLLPLLSGVRADLEITEDQNDVGASTVNWRLLVDPVLYAPPFELPVLLAGFFGTISADAADQGVVALTLTAAFGSVELPPNSLVVCGQAANTNGWVNLTAGKSFQWKQSNYSHCGW